VHRLVGHLAASHSNHSVANTSNEAMSDTDSMANSSNQAVSDADSMAEPSNDSVSDTDSMAEPSNDSVTNSSHQSVSNKARGDNANSPHPVGADTVGGARVVGNSSDRGSESL